MKYAVKAKIFLGSVILALLTLSVLFLVNNPGLIKSAPPAKPQVRLEQAEVVIDGFKFARNDGVGENWELTAKHAKMKKDTRNASLKDLEAVYNAKNGTVLKLTADNGTYDSKSKKMQAAGNDSDVVITSSNGYKMTSQKLAWDGIKKELTTDDKVTLCGKNIMIVGKGLVARSDLQEVKITNGVKTVFTPSR